MSNPRDQVMKWGVPINLETGEPYTDAQLLRVAKLKDAAKALLDVMHDCEGTDHGNPGFSSRRMAIANTHLEVALLMAIKGACESG